MMTERPNAMRMRRWISRSLILLATVAFTGTVAAQTTTVILVRHAEKMTTGGKDPELTEEGRARARHLAAMLKDVELDAIYSTPFVRTRETVAPVANAKGIDVTITEVGPGFEQALAERIMAEEKGGTVLVVGHSNTIGRTIAALGAGQPFDLDESEYGDLFVCTFPEEGEPRVLRLKF